MSTSGSSFDPNLATAQWLATLSPAQTEKAVAYTQGGHWVLLGNVLVSLVVAWILVRLGVFTWLRDRIERRRPRPRLLALLSGLIYVPLTWLMSLPWSIYAAWFRERSFGLSQQSLPDWLVESAIGTAIAACVGASVIAAFYALIRARRRSWWIWGAGLVGGLMALGLVLGPVLIEPIFNTYRPAPPGPVRDAVTELARKTGTPSDKIYIYDGSRQSERYTANVNGLGASARVAMSDVMFKKNADLAEVRAVVGHEMGHYRLQHALWSAGAAILLSVLAFLLLRTLYPTFRSLLGARRVGDIADPAGLPVVGAVLAVLGLLATPINNSLTRTIESQADRYSLEMAQEPDGLARALIKTAEYRAPSPSAVEEAIFYDHPSVERRVRRAMEWKARHLADRPQAAPETKP